MRIRTVRLTAFLMMMTFVASAQDKAAEIGKMMRYAADHKLFSGMLLVAEKGKIIYQQGFGYADEANKKPITEETLFNLCSVTKQFTAIAIMQLKEQGKLNYDDKLVQYFPQLPYPAVTIRQLLHHTSGLPEYFAMLGSMWKEDRSPDNTAVIKLLAQYKLPLRFTPGEKHEYCNTGYMLLASLVEKLSGTTYEKYLAENIFSKAGMRQTVIYQPGISAVVPANLALPYTYDYTKATMVLTKDYEPYYRQVTFFDGTVGDGGIHSCSRDMLAWDNALKTELLVKKTTMMEAFTSGTLNNGKAIAPVGYGFGWFVTSDSINGKYMFHTGGWPGFRQAFIRYPEKDRMILALRNNETDFAGIQRAVENILDGKPWTMPKAGLAYLLSATAMNGTAEELKRIAADNATNTIAREEEINMAGYGILAQGKKEAALEIMKINAALFPRSWNVYDSLGELYLLNGDKEQAKINYARSLELNPANDGAKKALAGL